MDEDAHLVLALAPFTYHDKAGTEMNTTTTFARGDMMDHKQINQYIFATRQHLRRLSHRIHDLEEKGWIAIAWEQPGKTEAETICGVQLIQADLQKVARHIKYREETTALAGGGQVLLMRPSEATTRRNDFAAIIEADSGTIRPWWMVN